MSKFCIQLTKRYNFSIEFRSVFRFIGITDTGGRGLVFLVKFQDKQENELLPWIDMREHFACQAMDFFKSRIHWPQEDEFEADDSDIE